MDHFQNELFETLFITDLFQNELFEALEENNLRGFRDFCNAAPKIDYDFNELYGAELGYKTILQLALEEEDGYPYVEELLIVIFFRSYFSLDIILGTFSRTERPHRSTIQELG